MAFWNRDKGPAERPLGLMPETKFGKAEVEDTFVKTEAKEEQPPVSRERRSMADIRALGAQRVEQARARRQETKAKWGDRLKNLWSRTKEGVKAGREYAHAPGELVSELSARTGEAVSEKYETGKAFVAGKAEQAGKFVSAKAEQVYNGTQEAYRGLETRAVSAYEGFQSRKNEIIQQVQAKLKERRDNKAFVRIGEILKQQQALNEEFNRLTMQVSGVEQFKSSLPYLEEEALAA